MEKVGIGGVRVTKNAAIGVFDSGIGGLTVLKELTRLMPHEKFIYFGDTGRAPYGCRPKEEITDFMGEILGFFQAQNIKLAVVACNAMTTVGMEATSGMVPFPLVGVNNGVEAALKVSRKKRVGVIATTATISSEKHLRYIEQLDPSVYVYPQACPKFVPLIEQGQITGREMDAAVREYMLPMKEAGIDAVIMACTHYPFISEVISRVVGDGMALINPARETAQDAYRILQQSGQLSQERRGGVTVCFSADVERAKKMAGFMLDVSQIDFRLVNLTEYGGDFL
jgi:glutamate racemase